MMEKTFSIGQTKSRWGKLDKALLVISVMAVGSTYIFLERFNQPRQKIRSVLQGDQNTPEILQADETSLNSDH